MQTVNIIEGLTILEKYHDRPDGFNCGAEHDVIYAYQTDRPVSDKDLERLIELGWFQEARHVEYQNDNETGGDFAAKYYDADETWMAYV